MARKAGVATDAAFAAFVAKNSVEQIVVVDARNPDVTVEPGDAKWGAESSAPIAGTSAAALRPRAVNLVYDRVNSSMDLEPLQPLLSDGLDTPIITHCGGGGRGQKAKVFLESVGYTNVLNGGGPKVTELWEQFGEL
jgi:rhodanese-related sulfurtransferase